MRQITIQHFKDHCGKELKDLPFAITKRGLVIAVCQSPNHAVEAPQSKTNHAVEARIKKVSKQKSPFLICPKHKVFYKTCGCSN